MTLVVFSSEDNNVSFIIQRLKELPSGIQEPKGDLLVLILSIELTSGKESSISGEIDFRIPHEDIKGRGFDPNAVLVILLKWDGKNWTKLPTKFISTDGKFNYYKGITESFSYFAVQLKPLETPKFTTPSATPITPKQQ